MYPLDDFDVCFSREDSDEKYVQDVLKRKAEKTANMVLHDGAKIFVCGSNAMAKDVNEAIIEILHKYGELSESQAKEKVAEMRIQDDYLHSIVFTKLRHLYSLLRLSETLAYSKFLTVNTCNSEAVQTMIFLLLRHFWLRENLKGVFKRDFVVIFFSIFSQKRRKIKTEPNRCIRNETYRALLLSRLKSAL